MASMLRIVRQLKPLLNISCSRAFHSQTQTWTRLALQRAEQVKGNALMSCYFSTKTMQRNVEMDFDVPAGTPKIDKLFTQMEIEARRTGRISLFNVLEILDDAKATKLITTTQSLLLIRCCGELLPEETNEYRTELVTKVMELINTSNITLDVSHYNALLKVHLENEHKISPTDFLKEMEAKNIEPNRVTYQRLIAHYCQNGDIAGASEILNFMKSKNLPISESVFIALINGHSKIGDMAGANAILTAMRTSNFEPTAETYLRLICGYAVKGNMEEINNVILEADKNNVFLSDADVLEVIFTLAVNGQHQHIDEMLTKLRKSFGYNQDVINVIFKLINRNQDDVAYKLLCNMVKASKAREAAGSGTFFIKQLVKAGRSFETVIAYCEELKRNNLNNFGVLKAVESALINRKPEQAILYMKKYMEEGYEVRPHFFWPILMVYKGNSAKIYETLRTMIEMKCTPDFDTLVDYVFPNVNMNDPDAVLKDLKLIGLPEEAIVNTLAVNAVLQNKINVATKLVNTYPTKISARRLVPILAPAAVFSRDLNSALMLLKKLDENNDDEDKTYFSGLFLINVYRVSQFNSQKLEEVLTFYKDNNFSVRDRDAEFIRSKFVNNVPTVIDQLLKDITSSDISTGSRRQQGEYAENEPFLSTRDMSLQELERYHEELKSKNINPRGVLRRMLILYCQQKDLEKAEKVKNELNSLSYLFTPLMYVNLLELYLHSKDSKKALEMVEQLSKTDSSFRIGDEKIFNLSTLLVKKGQIDDAVRLLEDHIAKSVVGNKSEMFVWSIFNLLNAVADTGDFQLARRLSDLFFTNNCATPNNMLLGPIIRCYLEKENYDGALEAFEEFHNKYKCAPYRSELFTTFIKTEDADRLQKVVDICSGIYGEMNTMFDLADAFISNGQYKQARKILSTPGLRARQRRLANMCEKYLDNNKIECLEQLVSLTKELFDIDRDEMFFQLLRGYAKIDDPDKALGVWTAMQDESVEPRERTLAFLAELLQKHNRPIPFMSPANQNEKVSVIANREFDDLISTGKLNEAVELYFKSNNSDMTVRQSSILITSLLKNDQFEPALDVCKHMLNNGKQVYFSSLKMIFGKLAGMGNVETIEELNGLINNEMKKTLGINNYLTRAYINSNRSEEMLTWLEKGFPENHAAFPLRGILQLLKANPEYTDRVMKLAQRYASKNHLLPLNMMWVHFFIKENFAIADEIFKATPKFNEDLIFIDVMREARMTKNDRLARKLLDVIKSSQMNENLKCSAYCGLIDVLSEKGEYEKAVETFEDAIQSGLSVSSFKDTTIHFLRNGLKKQGLPIPASLPDNVDQSSSSSSDSSDDEEVEEAKK